MIFLSLRVHGASVFGSFYDCVNIFIQLCVFRTMVERIELDPGVAVRGSRRYELE